MKPPPCPVHPPCPSNVGRPAEAGTARRGSTQRARKARARLRASIAGVASLGALLAGCAAPPAAPSASPAPGGTAGQAHARLLDAVNACNEPAYLAAWAPLFTLVTSTTPQPVTTREGLQRHLSSSCGKGPRPSVAIAQQSTRVSGAITVLAGQYRYKVAATPGAVPAEVMQNFTVVLERMSERWLVLAQHVSVAP